MSAQKKNLGAVAVKFAREVLNVDTDQVTNNHQTSVRDLEHVLASWPDDDGRGYRARWRKLTGRTVEHRPELAIPARINPTEERERFRAYQMGWRDRAVGRARRRDAFAHRPDLLAEYDRGERDGAEASGAAMGAAAERLGYDLERAIIDR